MRLYILVAALVLSVVLATVVGTAGAAFFLLAHRPEPTGPVSCVWRQPRATPANELLVISSSCSDGHERFVGCRPDHPGSPGQWYRCGCMLDGELVGERDYLAPDFLIPNGMETQADTTWVFNELCPALPDTVPVVQ
jgi:hypothetical protein